MRVQAPPIELGTRLSSLHLLAILPAFGLQVFQAAGDAVGVTVRQADAGAAA